MWDIKFKNRNKTIDSDKQYIIVYGIIKTKSLYSIVSQ